MFLCATWPDPGASRCTILYWSVLSEKKRLQIDWALSGQRLVVVLPCTGGTQQMKHSKRKDEKRWSVYYLLTSLNHFLPQLQVHRSYAGITRQITQDYCYFGIVFFYDGKSPFIFCLVVFEVGSLLQRNSVLLTIKMIDWSFGQIEIERSLRQMNLRLTSVTLDWPPLESRPGLKRCNLHHLCNLCCT